MAVCPYCHAGEEKQVRAGKNPSGSQRMLCTACRRKYTPVPFSVGYSGDMVHRAILMCLDGQSFRNIARQLGVAPQTVVNWVNSYVAQTSRAIYGLRRR